MNNQKQVIYDDSIRQQEDEEKTRTFRVNSTRLTSVFVSVCVGGATIILLPRRQQRSRRYPILHDEICSLHTFV
jgi:hypothetical protein